MTDEVEKSPVVEEPVAPVVEPVAEAGTAAPLSSAPEYIAPAVSADAAIDEVVAKTDKTKGVCDIVFLIDATGSMQPAIDDIKRNINKFFNELSAVGPNGDTIVKDWRARVIAYRDVQKDGSLRFARVLFKVLSITTLLSAIAVIAITLIRCFF